MATIDRKRLEAIQSRVTLVGGRGEEATKQALVLPMLDALGYDIWNPEEVCPEYQADFATKKLGQKEKVDLAILLDGVARIYIEVKSADMVLDGHQGQLARYFNATPSVSLAILTNGVEYRFFTDTGEPNIMDARPFHTFRVDAMEQGFDVLGRFHRASLSADAIRDYATELNYTAKIVAWLRDQIDLRDRDASDGFVRWVLSAEGMYDGRQTAGVIDRFRPLVKNALRTMLRDIVRRSVAALDEGVTAPEPPQPQVPELDDVPDVPAEVEVEEQGSARIVTTERELAAFAILREQFERSALAEQTLFDPSLRREVPIELSYKDTSGYFGVYFNKPSFWFARLAIDARHPWVGLTIPISDIQGLVPGGFEILAPHPFAQTRIAISSPDDLRALEPVLLAAMGAVIRARQPARKLVPEPG